MMRLQLLASPREMTCLPLNDPRRDDRYRRLESIVTFNVPRRMSQRQAVDAAQRWAVQRITWT